MNNAERDDLHEKKTIPRIILIGPMCAGKSTLAQGLSAKLGIPRHEMDELRWDYYAEMGYDPSQASDIARLHGTIGLLHFWKPYEAYAVERILEDHAEGVIDFGAGHSVYRDEDLFRRVQKALSGCAQVVLVLPCDDADESVRILNARFSEMLRSEDLPVEQDMLAENEHFVRHPSNGLLAKFTVYTFGKTPEEVCDEIIGLL